MPAFRKSQMVKDNDALTCVIIEKRTHTIQVWLLNGVIVDVERVIK